MQRISDRFCRKKRQRSRINLIYVTDSQKDLNVYHKIENVEMEENVMAKILIIGSGPAGVSAALYAVRAGAEVTVISKGSGSLAKAELIQNYYGFEEPIVGTELERRGIEGAKKLGVRFVEDEVVWLGMNDSFTSFVVRSGESSYEADSVILAAGAARKAPKLAGIKEFEGKGVSYCAICDGFFYRGKRAAVLGSGEYALHEAETLLPHASKVLLFTDGAEPDLAIPETIELHTEKLAAIAGEQRVAGVRLADDTLVPVDGVFVAYGTAGSADMARKIGAALDNGHLVVDKEMATNIPGLFAAGDCTGGLMQVAKAVYEGAAAGLSAVKYVRGKIKK